MSERGGVALHLLTVLGVTFMRLMGQLPLSWVRALGWLLGRVLHAVAGRRRRITRTNIMLCFPQLPEQEARRLVAQTFVYLAQAWLDRGWLWHAPRERVLQRLTLTGDWQALQNDLPTIVFAPHFQGLDAGGTALSLFVHRRLASIYSTQSNRGVDAWLLRGRRRFAHWHLISRSENIKRVVSQLRDGALLYLLPDLDFGPEASVFVPFFGVPTATVPSLSRFARLGQARVFTVVTRMTPQGYEVQVLPCWDNFPTDDALADTARMNQELQKLVCTMPAQYHWVHKRFKTRPEGVPDLYE
jgi:Kdo2-lipid IVA lauroyltransferase/acyltransferase